MTRVAYQGEAGAFGHAACITFLPDAEPVAKPRFADVVASVTRGETEFGMLPVENSSAGPVEEVQDLLAASKLTVVASHSLPVRMHLLGLPGVTLEEIRTIVSHPIAIKQCAQTLAGLGVPTEIATNTAIAASELARSGDRTRAVLASEAAAEANGLAILRRDMHDRPDNATRFFVVSRGEG